MRCKIKVHHCTQNVNHIHILFSKTHRKARTGRCSVKREELLLQHCSKQSKGRRKRGKTHGGGGGGGDGSRASWWFLFFLSTKLTKHTSSSSNSVVREENGPRKHTRPWIAGPSPTQAVEKEPQSNHTATGSHACKACVSACHPPEMRNFKFRNRKRRKTQSLMPKILNFACVSSAGHRGCPSQTTAWAKGYTCAHATLSNHQNHQIARFSK